MEKLSIEEIAEVLEKDKVILCPTDTVWGLSCLANSVNGIEKIQKIKVRSKSKSFIVLFYSLEQAKNYFDNIPEAVEKKLKAATEPTTVILNNGKGVNSACFGSNNSLAFRIIKSGYLNKLIQELNFPIVSTSANISGNSPSNKLEDIESSIRNEVDLIVENVDSNKNSNSTPSTILKFEHNKFVRLR